MAENILVICPDAIQETLQAQPLFAYLKQQAQTSHIDVLAPEQCRPVLARMPEVSSVIDMPIDNARLHWDIRKSIASELGYRDYHRCLVLPDTHYAAVIPWLARIPNRKGWQGSWFSISGFIQHLLLNDGHNVSQFKVKSLQHDSQQYLALVDKHSAETDVPEPKLSADKRNAAQLIGRFNLTLEKPALVWYLSESIGAEAINQEREQVETALTEGCQVWLLGATDKGVVGELDETNILVLDATDLNLSLGDQLDIIALASRLVTSDQDIQQLGKALGKS